MARDGKAQFPFDKESKHSFLMLVPKAAVMHDTLTCEPHIGTCGFYPLNNTKKQTNTLLKTFPLNPQTKNIEGFSHTPAHPSHATRGALFWHTLVSPSCQTHPFWQGVCATLQKPVQPLLPRGICCISLHATFAKRPGALVYNLFGTPFVKRSCMKLLATLLARGLHQVS